MTRATVLGSVKAASRRLRDGLTANLDRHCARRPEYWQVGSEGMAAFTGLSKGMDSSFGRISFQSTTKIMFRAVLKPVDAFLTPFLAISPHPPRNSCMCRRVVSQTSARVTAIYFEDR